MVNILVIGSDSGSERVLGLPFGREFGFGLCMLSLRGRFGLAPPTSIEKMLQTQDPFTDLESLIFGPS